MNKFAWQTTPLNVHFIESVARHRAYECFNIQNTDSWATPIKAFLETKAEYLEESEAKRMKRIAPGYTLTNSVLYKKGFSTLFLRCVTRLVMTTIPRELHEGYTAKGINGESLYTVTIEINCHSISIVDSSQ